MNIKIKDNIVLISVCIGLFLTTLDTGIITIALQKIAFNLNVSISDVGILISGYIVSMLSFLIIAGRIGDSFGKVKCVIFGYFLFLITSILIGQSNTLFQLSIYRIIQGCGAAFLQANVMGIINEQQANENNYKYIAYSMMAISIGPLLAPVLSSYIIFYFNWKYLFYMNIPFCIIGMVFILHYKELFSEKNNMLNNFDFVGMSLLIIFLSLIAISMYILSINMFLLFLISVALTICSFILFVFVETKKETPFIPINSYCNYQSHFIFIGALIFGLSAGVLFTLSPILLINKYDLSYPQTGFLVAFASIGILTIVNIKKFLNIDFNEFKEMRYGMLGMMISFILLSFFNLSSLTYAIYAFLYGIFAGIFQSANIKASSKINNKASGTTAGLLRFSQNIGILIGSSFSLFLIELFKNNLYLSWMFSFVIMLIYLIIFNKKE